jgi:hypothetical protein
MNTRAHARPSRIARVFAHAVMNIGASEGCPQWRHQRICRHVGASEAPMALA